MNTLGALLSFINKTCYPLTEEDAKKIFRALKKSVVLEVQDPNDSIKTGEGGDGSVLSRIAVLLRITDRFTQDDIRIPN